MANLPEIDEFTVGVYQLELTDPIEGGADGIDNYQAKALTNRTLYLKNRNVALESRVTTLESQFGSLSGLITALQAYIPKKRGWVSGINPGSGTIGQSYTCGGDIASCTLQARQFQANKYLVTVNAPTIGTVGYKVQMTTESMTLDANWVNDTNFREPIFKPISATQFWLIVDEDDSGFNQNLKIHMDVIIL